MPRIMVGLLAAVGTAMSALVGLTRGGLVWWVVGVAAAASGLSVFAVAPVTKKISMGNINKYKTIPSIVEFVTYPEI
jgi:hypothetical protein